jgi:hypothetical protein
VASCPPADCDTRVSAQRTGTMRDLSDSSSISDLHASWARLASRPREPPRTVIPLKEVEISLPPIRGAR